MAHSTQWKSSIHYTVRCYESTALERIQTCTLNWKEDYSYRLEVELPVWWEQTATWITKQRYLRRFSDTRQLKYQIGTTSSKVFGSSRVSKVPWKGTVVFSLWNSTWSFRKQMQGVGAGGDQEHIPTTFMWSICVHIFNNFCPSR